MRRYLVTGGCGFIGSHLVDSLLRDGHLVRIVDDLSTGVRANVDERADLRIADLRHPNVVEDAADGVDGIFHLAAVASVVRCNEAWLATHAVNLTATLRLLDVARRDRLPVVYASSAAVYGNHAAPPVDETAPVMPTSSYGADKAAGELHARAAAQVHGVPSFGLRFFNVYGPRQRPDDSYAGVISIFRDRIGRGLPITIYGDGGQSRDFVFVADVVRALRGAMARLEDDPAPRAEVANVGTGRATTIGDLAATLMTLLERHVPVTHTPPRPGDIRASHADTRHLHRLLGMEAETSLEEGLRTLLGAASP
jgi:UDP-glucose 4-epimerase